MKVKYFFTAVLFILLITAVSQIFSIYPFAKDIFKVYKSGYFKELDNKFNIIAQSFLQIKSMSRATYAWIYLQEIEKDYGIKIKVYDFNGKRVLSPGDKVKNDDFFALKEINSSQSSAYSNIQNKKYYYFYPFKFKEECSFCHSDLSNSEMLGAITFKSDFNAKIYYSSERIIIFTIISIVISILLFFTIKWDPEKNIKELFDK